MDKKILIVDDEEHIVELLKFNLSSQGYEVDVAYDGLDGFVKMREMKPDLVLLDIMIPSIDGFEVLKKVRSDKEIKNTPVIMLTAKNMEEYKIEGLQIGADDYITKPFSVKELLARVNAVLRRYNVNKDEANEVVVGDIKIDLENYEVTKGGVKLDLTLKEFELLKILAENRGKVLSRNLLLDKIWGYEYFGETRTVDVHIRHLRKKIEDEDKNPKYIETIRGVGYKLK
ncbi:response regulator transcription factor [Alkalithermobacter paradoxus]|uniref:Stage 0 sporulation protein A homolog n=1 Tax=Alkalithermobacter paradoxus TaxID=29349 RepID=A0A1V4IAH6_9FIRM|nr:alkaline phosphatase synthesis transcriptional regulatory protein PhoP [[Clostridium] thermoalcaliphilum]